jgi:hypothetical protein
MDTIATGAKQALDVLSQTVTIERQICGESFALESCHPVEDEIDAGQAAAAGSPLECTAPAIAPLAHFSVQQNVDN